MLNQPFDEKFHISLALRHRPFIGLAGQNFKLPCCTAVGIELHHGALLAHRLAQQFVVRHRAHVVQLHEQITVGDPGEIFVQAAPLLLAANHVGQDVETADAVLPVQQLDQGVGIGHRGGLVADHHDHLLGGLGETDHAVGDARRRIHQQHVQVVTELTEGANQHPMLRRRELRHTLDPGRRGDDFQTLGSGHDDLLQPPLPREYVGEVVTGADPQHHIHVGQPQIGIHQHHPLAQLPHRQGEVDRNVGLSHTSLASGHRDDPNRVLLGQATQSRRLIGTRGIRPSV